jgi:transcriptional regulator with XRE-family HTH domain
MDCQRLAKHSKALGPQVGLRLSRLMKARGLTDRALGDKAQISFTTIQNLRNGLGGQAGIGTIANVAKALGVTPEWLAYGAGQGPDDLTNR